MNSCQYFPTDSTGGFDWTKDSAGQSGGPLQNNEPPQPCAMEAFFEYQRQLHPNQRSTGALLVCTCPRCQRVTM